MATRFSQCVFHRFSQCVFHLSSQGLTVFRVGNNCGSFHRSASTKNSTIQSLQDETALQPILCHRWQAPVKLTWHERAKQCVDYIMFNHVYICLLHLNDWEMGLQGKMTAPTCKSGCDEFFGTLASGKAAVLRFWRAVACPLSTTMPRLCMYCFALFVVCLRLRLYSLYTQDFQNQARLVIPCSSSVETNRQLLIKTSLDLRRKFWLDFHTHGPFILSHRFAGHLRLTLTWVTWHEVTWPDLSVNNVSAVRCNRIRTNHGGEVASRLHVEMIESGQRPPRPCSPFLEKLEAVLKILTSMFDSLERGRDLVTWCAKSRGEWWPTEGPPLLEYILYFNV